MKKNLKLYFLLFLLTVNVFIFYTLYQDTQQKLIVAFLDVGQGDSIFIQAPGGRQMLIDGGINNAVLRELGQVMPSYDRSIDVVLVTHADQDHIGGLPSVLERFKVGLFVRTLTTADTAAYQTLLDLVKEKKIKEEIIVAPENLILGGGAELDILFPDKDTTDWETNESSIVGRLIYGGTSFLLNGDSPIKIEKYLVEKYGSEIKSDVLKAGHHGSKTSSSEIFVATVAPTYSVISAGLKNKYGHPNQETIDTLNKFGTKILGTLGRGMILFQSDGQSLDLIKGEHY